MACASWDLSMQLCILRAYGDLQEPGCGKQHMPRQSSGLCLLLNICTHPVNYGRCIIAHVCADACMQAGSQASSSASGSDANSHSDSDSDSSADSQPAAAEQGVQAMQSDGNEQVQGQAAASGGYCLYCMHFQTLTD